MVQSYQHVGIVVLLRKKSWWLVVQSEGRELCHLDPHSSDTLVILGGTQPLEIPRNLSSFSMLFCAVLILDAYFLGFT